MLKSSKERKNTIPMDSKTKKRRKKAIENLEKQLKSGTKPEKIDGKTHINKKVNLSPTDIERITKELEILKSRV